MKWKSIINSPKPYIEVIVQLEDGTEKVSYMYPDKSWAWNDKVIYWHDKV